MEELVVMLEEAVVVEVALAQKIIIYLGAVNLVNNLVVPEVLVWQLVQMVQCMIKLTFKVPVQILIKVKLQFLKQNKKD